MAESRLPQGLSSRSTDGTSPSPSLFNHPDVFRNTIAPDEEDFAFQLGLNADPDSQHLRRSTDDLRYMISRLKLESASRQEMVIARFCCRYLFSLLHAFLNPPIQGSGAYETESQYRLQNAFAIMLRFVQRSRYFAQLFLSQDPACIKLTRMLPDYLTSHFAPESTRLEQQLVDAKDPLEKARVWERIPPLVEQLCIILTLLHGETYTMSVPVKILTTTLEKWDERASSPVDRVRMALLSGLLKRSLRPDLEVQVYELRGGLEGLESCAQPGCKAEDDLYQCAVCKTVLYCGREHQRAHWMIPIYHIRMYAT